MQQRIHLTLSRRRDRPGFALDIGDGHESMDNVGLALAVLIESGKIDDLLNAFPTEAYSPRLTVLSSDR